MPMLHTFLDSTNQELSNCVKQTITGKMVDAKQLPEVRNTERQLDRYTKNLRHLGDP